MTLRTTLLGIVIAIGCLLTASAQRISPIAKAMLDGYTELLKENPKDYFTLYQRGAQYYALSMYEQALADVVKAIDFTPAKDRDMYAQEYSLLTDICLELNEYENAYKAVDQALKFDPSSYSLLYKKGNVCLYLNKPQEAYQAFSSLQRLKSRSQEAYIGMAKADIMMGKNAEAADLMKEAEQADPNNYITYCRLGDICVDMKDYDKAAVNYLAAFGLADDTSRPVSALYNLSATQYPAVANALDYAISKSAKPSPLLFLKANLASVSGNYESAYDALQTLLTSAEGKEASVYTLLASTNLALNKIPEAKSAIDSSLAIAENPENLTLAARIALAQNRSLDALSYAANANAASGNMEAMNIAALAYIAENHPQEALSIINEAIMNDPGDPKPLILRAYINSLDEKTKQAASGDYARAAATAPEEVSAIAYKAIGQTLSGKQIDGDATITKLINENPTKDGYYWAAVYYAQTGNLDKAAEMRDKAVASGYANAYNLKSNCDPAISLAPLIKSGK